MNFGKIRPSVYFFFARFLLPRVGRSVKRKKRFGRCWTNSLAHCKIFDKRIVGTPKNEKKFCAEKWTKPWGWDIRETRCSISLWHRRRSGFHVIKFNLISSRRATAAAAALQDTTSRSCFPSPRIRSVLLLLLLQHISFSLCATNSVVINDSSEPPSRVDWFSTCQSRLLHPATSVKRGPPFANPPAKFPHHPSFELHTFIRSLNGWKMFGISISRFVSHIHVLHTRAYLYIYFYMLLNFLLLHIRICYTQLLGF